MCDDYESSYQIECLVDEIYDLKEQLKNQVDITLDLQVENAHLLRALKIAGVVAND